MKKLIFTAIILIGITKAFTQELAYSGRSGSDKLLWKPDKINADFLIKNVNIVNVENGTILAGKYVAMRDSIIIGIYDKEVCLQNSGQLGSLVLLDENPLEDISNTKSIHAVFLRGRYLNRAMLDNLLEEAEDISSKIKSPY